MADTAVAITAGTGTNVDTRTEATNGNHRQVVCIGDPSTNLGVAPVDATKGMAVDLSQTGSFPALPAGTNVIGRVGSRSVRVSVTPTISTGIYAALDGIGGLMEFTNAVAVSGLGGVIQTITVIDKDNEKAALNIYFSDRTFTAVSDNAAWTISDSDAANAVGIVNIATTDYVSNGSANAVATVKNVGLAFVANGTSLFAQMHVTATPTYTATSDLIIILTILQD